MLNDDLLYPLANVTHRSNLVRLSNWLNPPSDPRSSDLAIVMVRPIIARPIGPVVVDGRRTIPATGLCNERSPLHQRVVQPLGGLPYFNWLDQHAGAAVQSLCNGCGKVLKSLPFRR
jgi:hypothetical protein